uniref:sulfatase-like hydrolase/transferase n=1 Tax=Caldimonas tepidiphila TaxID=2315841 RepID=UPI00196B86A0
ITPSGVRGISLSIYLRNKAPPDDLDDLPAIARSLALSFDHHACITGQDLWAQAVRAYLAGISFMDAQIGRLLQALDASPHARNTVVVLWSDHGFHLGEKFHWHKQALWERSTHIPFLIGGAGAGTVGGRVFSAVSLVDLFPTLTELCGVPRPLQLSGRSLVPLLRDPRKPWDHPVLIEREGGHRAVRSNEWRYIRYADGSEELYDHRVDPQEWRNLAPFSKYSSVKAELARHFP